jgi:inner membrane protein involved in colicin E2 resistance
VSLMKRIAAIVVIYVGACAAWLILGATIFSRTYRSGAALKDRVVSTWGAPHEQRAPTASFDDEPVLRQVRAREDGTTVLRTEEQRVSIQLPLERSRVDVELALEHRQKGLLWYSTYTVTFGGQYTFRNTSDRDILTFTLPFPARTAIVDELALSIDGRPLEMIIREGGVSGTARVAPGAEAVMAVSYKSQGLESWHYHFGDGISQVRDFELVMRTDFGGVDFPPSSLSPTEKRARDGGSELRWRYGNLLSGYRLGIVMPERPQPGPLAARISFFAPVSLFFFFLLMFIITTVRGIELHPMNYFFLGAAFFSFHLLLAYLVDHVSIHIAMATASAVSVLLVVSYLRLVVNPRFALRDAMLSQLIYLVAFSYAFFLEGYTGLTVTVIAILTLFVIMQMTGRTRWSEKFAAAGS